MSKCASKFSCGHYHLSAHWEVLLLSIRYLCKYGILNAGNFFFFTLSSKYIFNDCNFLLISLFTCVMMSIIFLFPLPSWFHGDLSRHAAEALLLSNGTDGSYLLRNSNAGLGCYALSVRLAGNKTYHQTCHYICDCVLTNLLAQSNSLLIANSSAIL